MDAQSIQKALQDEKNQDLRNSIYAAFLEDQERGANMIVAFAAEQGTTLTTREVIDHLNSLDDEEIEIELTAEMLASTSGGQGKCGF